jgi:ubiquinone/menaquinone biosynthesis C-methylase UbiE
MFESKIQELFNDPIFINRNIIAIGSSDAVADNQAQTEKIFSDKWTQMAEYEDAQKGYDFQKEWFLSLYGFGTEEKLQEYLRTKNTVIDTGCGLGYKSEWFARLAPETIVIGIDISDSLEIAAAKYAHLPNLFFLRGDIANTGLKSNSIDFVVCDQVIMHTEVPETTFAHLSDVTSEGGEFACYVYSKKALPRELVDDYFRKATHKIENETMWEFSDQLTVLGKRLSELNVSFECPDIPVLGIKGGTYDIQRFIYWNFLKCFWNEKLGFEISKSTNYDWYAPSNAKRFSKEDFLQMAADSKLDINFLHEEEACYSARFGKKV